MIWYYSLDILDLYYFSFHFNFLCIVFFFLLWDFFGYIEIYVFWCPFTICAFFTSYVIWLAVLFLPKYCCMCCYCTYWTLETVFTYVFVLCLWKWTYYMTSWTIVFTGKCLVFVLKTISTFYLVTTIFLLFLFYLKHMYISSGIYDLPHSQTMWQYELLSLLLNGYIYYLYFLFNCLCYFIYY